MQRAPTSSRAAGPATGRWPWFLTACVSLGLAGCDELGVRLERVDGGVDAEHPDAEAPKDADVALDATGQGDAEDLAPDGVSRDGGPPGDAALSDAALSDAALSDAAPPDAAPLERQRVELGRVVPGETVRLEVPPGFQSMLIQARGQPGGVYVIDDLEGPDGPLAAADPESDAPGRVAGSPEVATAMVPSTDAPEGQLRAGLYLFNVKALRGDGPLSVEAWLGAPGASVSVNVWLPPATGLTADDEPVVSFTQALAVRLGQAIGLTTVDVRVALLPVDAAAVLEVDGAAGDFEGLAALAAPTVAAPGGLDLVLVESIIDGGAEIPGFSGGLPAPFGWRGTPANVAAVRTSLLADFPEAVADAATHELGHALGLFHTTEPFGDRYDAVSDTPECPLTCDENGDGALFARECGARASREAPCRGASDNFMFWTLGGERASTPAQRRLARGHPLVD